MEIVFYDIETTTIPVKEIIEFGAIVLDKTGLFEKESYSTLVYSDKVSQHSIEINGITAEMLRDQPKFPEVADKIYGILDGRIWAGHNINSFDNPHIERAFRAIGKEPPKPCSTIDTLPLLRRTFGKRAGKMSMASLGNYFGLGQERHRALEDSRMTLDVLKNCCMIMMLEEHAGYADFENKVDEQQIPANTVELLNNAISGQQEIWVSYDGGSNPNVPRKIRPQRWVHAPWLIEAYCFQSQMNKNFTQRKITEIRNQEWTVQRNIGVSEEEG